jgi:outer membrane protein
MSISRSARGLFASVALLALPAAASAQSVLSLDDARQAARDHSWDLAAAESALAQAEILLDSARAVLLPRVEATASYTYNGTEVTFDVPNPLEPLIPYLTAVRDGLDPSLPDPTLFGGTGEPSTIQFRHDVRGSLSATQTLFNPRAFPLRRQAFRTIDLARHASAQIEQGLDGVVIDAFFGACAAQRFIRIAERNVELARLSAERTVAAQEAGVGNRFEANRARVDLAAAERDLLNAQTTYQIAIEAMAILLERSPDFDVVEPAPVALPASIDAAAEEAAATRPDVRVWDLQLALDEERVQESRVEWLPVVTASITGNVQRESAFGGEAFTWNAGVQAYWAIYDGGLRRAERRRRELDLVDAEIRRDQAAEQVGAEVARLSRALEQEERNVVLAQQQVELARTNVEVTQFALEQGAASELDVQYAQQQAYLSEIALADAEVNRLQRQYELALALDTLD